MLHYNQDKTMKSKKLLIALAGCAAFVATACHGDLDIIQAVSYTHLTLPTILLV